MNLEEPRLLLLVAPAVLLARAASRRSAVGLGPVRAAAAGTLRLLVLLALGLVLAGARAVQPTKGRTVVFCVDVSESIAPAVRQRLYDWTRKAAAQKGPGDRAGLVVFGSRARVEVPPAELYEPGEPSFEGLARDRSAIDHALRAAGGLLRQETDAHVVLLSDGNGDGARALREASALASAGVPVITVAVDLQPSPREVLVGDVSAPPVVSEGEAFLLKVQLVARSGGPARLHVETDGGQLATTDVELAPGTNVVALPQRLARAGSALFRVTLEAPLDGDVANNTGGAFVRVRGRPRALYAQAAVRGDGGRVVSPAEVARPLARALQEEGFDVKVVGPDELPVGVEELAGLSVLILGDISAERWTEEQMAAVRAWVVDQGGGLVALGGEQAFGLGGYYRTPIEEVLPVSCSLRGKKVLPSMALALAIDRSGSMEQSVGNQTKLQLAIEGAARTIEVLQPFDLVGVMGFDSDPEWVVAPVTVEDPLPLVAKVRAGIGAGGGTEIGPAIELAWRGLRNLQAPLKHIVLLTDGKSASADWAKLVADCRRDRVTLTTVGIGNDIDRQLLTDLATGTGGRFLHTSDPRTIPRLLTKEAVAATRALLVERSIVPRITGDLGVPGEALEGMPPLLGFVLTHPKPEAEVLLDTGPGETAQDGPLLVRWRAGLGKSVAFTSDASARWCARWIGWPGFRPVLAAAVGWAARDPEPPGFRASLQLEQGRGLVRLEASGPDGAPVNGLAAEARVTGPPGAEVPPVKLEQRSPGIYEGEFDAGRPGAYFAQVAVTPVAPDGAPAPAPRPAGSAGAVLAYPREYRDLQSDRALLERLARVTRGEALSLDDPPGLVFGGERTGREAMQPLGPWLLGLAACLLVLEVAIRKLVVPEALLRLLRRDRAAREDPAAAGALLASLRAHKEAERGARAAHRAAVRAASDRMPAEAAAPVTVARAPDPAPAAPPPAAAPPPDAPPPPPKAAPPPKRPSTRAPAPEVPDDGSPMSKLLKAKRDARGGPPRSG